MAECMDQCLSIDELSHHLGISNEAAHEWISERKIPVNSRGRVWQVRLEDVDEWIRNDEAGVKKQKSLQTKSDSLNRLGFKSIRSGVHLARTMMLDELQGLIAYLNDPNANKSDYIQAIELDNCLAKPSGKTRNLTAQHLSSLYGLDPEVTIFRALRFFWDRDTDGQPLLALLCAYARDSILRSSAKFIQSHSIGDIVTRKALEEFIDSREPGRFSQATLKSTAGNINGTWTKSGHLHGRSKKIRSMPLATSGAVSYALFLDYLQGIRGELFLDSEYCRLLNCSPIRLIELATDASKKGWIVFKHIGNVIEVLFPNLLTEQETEWLRV